MVRLQRELSTATGGCSWGAPRHLVSGWDRPTPADRVAQKPTVA